jgi:hypothetical protein
MKKINWFFENYVPFKWKYWIMLHATWIELNSNSIESAVKDTSWGQGNH